MLDIWIAALVMFNKKGSQLFGGWRSDQAIPANSLFYFFPLPLQGIAYYYLFRMLHAACNQNIELLRRSLVVGDTAFG
jgi:hypothetical protein